MKVETLTPENDAMHYPLVFDDRCSRRGCGTRIVVTLENLTDRIVYLRAGGAQCEACYRQQEEEREHGD